MDRVIVDVHTHIFGEIDGCAASGFAKWPAHRRVAVGAGQTQVIPTAHTPEMLLARMDRAGVDRAVLLQGPFYGDCNQYVLDAIRRWPERLAGATCVDFWEPGARERFEDLCSHQEFRAVKLEMSEATGLCGIHPHARVDDPELGWLWDEMERRRLVLVLDLGAVGSNSYQTAAVRDIAAGRPELKIAIAHLGQPNPTVEARPALRRLWQEQMDLGLLPNVWFDTASLPAYLADEGYPYPGVGRYLETAVERIGPEKIMWGTDIPGTLSCGTYPQLVEAGKIHLRFLSPSDRELVMGGNAAGVFFPNLSGSRSRAVIQEDRK